MKKTILLLMCMLMILIFTSCQIHIDTDPWPTSPGYTETADTPVTDPMVTTNDPVSPTAPAVTDAPQQPSNENFVPIVTPTPQPNTDVVEPGFNG